MLEWIFDGIGSELISVLIGLAIGGGAGYYIGVKTTNKIKQKQKAGGNAKQEQVGQVNNYGSK